MYKEVLRAIDNISIYPVISLSIFFVFFVALGIYWIRADKSFIKSMEEMPLDNENNTNTENAR